MKEELSWLFMKMVGKRTIDTIGTESMGRSYGSNLIWWKRNRGLLEVVKGVKEYDWVKQKIKIGNNPS